jgi:flagellar M-ring protein FliF
LLILRPLMRLLTVRLTPSPAVTARIAAERRAVEAANAAAAAHPPAPALASPAHDAGQMAALPGTAAAGGPGMPVVPLLENYDLPPAGSAVDVMVDHLKVLAEKEPERVAEVVKQWMQKNGRIQ